MSYVKCPFISRSLYNTDSVNNTNVRITEAWICTANSKVVNIYIISTWCELRKFKLKNNKNFSCNSVKQTIYKFGCF